MQLDKHTHLPMVHLYKDKATDQPKGDATLTYEDPEAATAAVNWFNGCIICHVIAF